MSEHELLIWEARLHPANLHANGFASSARMIEALADALETAEAERDAALAVIAKVRDAARANLADCSEDSEMSAFWVLEATS